MVKIWKIYLKNSLVSQNPVQNRLSRKHLPQVIPGKEPLKMMQNPKEGSMKILRKNKLRSLKEQMQLPKIMNFQPKAM
ncbi:MAG: hypothetical protein EA393_10195 [Bacteroidetes bacterium]|nr:MAG: hypothetical protein EA393_10195 [Bacteroidota bacterium]